jgi:hypothetical protein
MTKIGQLLMEIERQREREKERERVEKESIEGNEIQWDLIHRVGKVRESTPLNLVGSFLYKEKRIPYRY